MTWFEVCKLKQLIEESYQPKGKQMKINLASTGGFCYSIPASARNQKPQGDSILVGG